MVRPLARLAPFAVMIALAAPVAGQESVYKKGLKSTVWVVQIVNRDGNRLSMRTGSGSVIDVKQKLILTNYHVVEDNPDVTVCFPQFDKQGKLIPEREKYREMLEQIGLRGKVIAKDSTRDLAIIQLQTPLPPGTPALRLANDSPETASRVHSIGSPGVSAALFNYTDGAVKTVVHQDWKAMRMPNDPNPLQLSAKVIVTSSGINKGDSGGPLMNDKAELVGVTQGGSSGGAQGNPVSYFIDVSEVKYVLKAHKIRLTTPSAAVAAETQKEKPATTTADTTNDPEKKEKQAASKLDLAKSLAASGKPEKALERYKDIIKEFPGTKAAAEAKELLEKK